MANLGFTLRQIRKLNYLVKFHQTANFLARRVLVLFHTTQYKCLMINLHLETSSCLLSAYLYYIKRFKIMSKMHPGESTRQCCNAELLEKVSRPYHQVFQPKTR